MGHVASSKDGAGSVTPSARPVINHSAPRAPRDTGSIAKVVAQVGISLGLKRIGNEQE
jgi:hypothetical protein